MDGARARAARDALVQALEDEEHALRRFLAAREMRQAVERRSMAVIREEEVACENELRRDVLDFARLADMHGRRGAADRPSGVFEVLDEDREVG